MEFLCAISREFRVIEPPRLYKRPTLGESSHPVVQSGLARGPDIVHVRTD